MKITVTSDTHPPITLGDDDERQFIAGLLPQGDAVMQVAQRMRAERVKLFDRGNRQISWNWSVTYGHEDLPAALLFQITHIEAIPLQGLVKISQNRSGALSERWIPDAWLRPVRCVSHVGTCTVWNYSLVAAEILTEKP